jgi:hypothetical protein
MFGILAKFMPYSQEKGLDLGRQYSILQKIYKIK